MSEPQVVSFDGGAESLLKAALLARLHSLPARHSAELRGSLFPVMALDSEAYTINDVQFAYLRRFGRESYNYSEYDIERLLNQLDWARRFVVADRYSLLLEVLDQFLTRGLPAVECGASREARQFLSRARRVKRELRRVEAGTRFQVVAESRRETLVGRCEFRHDIADLVLGYFTHRFPGQRVVLVLRDGVLIGEGGRVMRRPPIDLPGGDAEWAAAWARYAQTQARCKT